MRRTFKSGYSLVALFVAFIVLALGISFYVSGWRLDLTENHIYTLSDGTQKILSEMETPVELTLYFSDQQTADLPALRTYASRVRELLEEYVNRSDGKITLKTVDPEPFSEAEDNATLAGLEGVPAGRQGEKVFFGLVGEAPSGEQEVIPFFQMNQEGRLEYDLTKLVYNLEHPEPPVVGVISNLPVEGGPTFMAQSQNDPWVFVQQLEDLFDVRWLPTGIEAIDDDVDVLLVIHPVGLTDATRFAIDQYVLGGGKAVVFMDPNSEAAGRTGGGPMSASIPRTSDLPAILKQWGVQLSDQFVADYDNALVVSVGQQRRPVRHVGLLGLTPEDFDDSFVALSGLENLNLSTTGYFEPTAGATTKLLPLLKSSSKSQPMDTDKLMQLQDPEALLNGFKATGKQYTLAAQLTGPAKTAFPDGVTIEEPPRDDEATGEEGDTSQPETRTLKPDVTEGDINVMVVGDTDILSDRLWVQVDNFFGQSVATPWADNGAFLVNTLEYYAGSQDLISIRSRGQYNRPFTRVEDMRRDAEEQLLDRQQELQQRLQETEQRLAELESQRGQNEQGLLTPEQKQTLEQFQQRKVEIRKDLRDVQHQLNEDIDQLAAQLKILNIVVFPLLLTLLLAFLNWGWRRFAAR
ncbi:Gldg family protein [Marinobacteraceae bacterium S3BR75-40.1]